MLKVIEMKEVSKKFETIDGEIEVLSNISFEVRKGDIVSIVGPSGCGKTTLLNLISGLEKRNSGEIIINGNIGYMFQKDHLFEWRNIMDNIMLGLEIKGQINDDNIAYIENLLEKYGLIEFKKNFPKELSGGMRQRIALIRTMAIKPSLLLLDEPFSALDYQTRLKVSDDIYKMIKREGLSAILVTHDISEAISMSDYIIVLSNRPSIIKKIHKIEFSETNADQITKRCSTEFQSYFDMIWKEVVEDE